jgi:G3E family GTPase
MAAASPGRLGVVVVTGFLGSGKTTLLSRLLGDPAMGRTAVLVNELGEVALDHELLREVDARTAVLANGCVCCTLRDDLSESLRDLLDMSDRGEIEPLERVVIETTGLAEPAPILNTILSDRVVAAHFRPEIVVTTVDAAAGSGTLDRHPESVKQVSAADRLVVTKSDLIDDGNAVRELEDRLHAINPGAPAIRAVLGEVRLDDVLPPVGAEPGHPAEVAAWLETARGVGESHEHHGGDIRAHSLVLDAPLDWTAFGVWLTMLLGSRGEEVLRVKGLVDVGGPGPVVINGVQHVMHPPRHLDAWPSEDHRSRIVFITRGIDQGVLQASLVAFQRAGEGV